MGWGSVLRRHRVGRATGDAVVPAVPDDADPSSCKDSHGMRVIFARGACLAVNVCRPGIGGARLGAGEDLALRPCRDRVRADRYDRVSSLEQQDHQPPVRGFDCDRNIFRFTVSRQPANRGGDPLREVVDGEARQDLTFLIHDTHGMGFSSPVDSDEERSDRNSERQLDPTNMGATARRRGRPLGGH